jgi:uronate dehydrogenase
MTAPALLTGASGAPVLLTGASGALGRYLANSLAEAGLMLRLTDIAPFPVPLPKGSTFTQADLEDGVAILRLAEGCKTILHFGGISVEKPFETVIGPNIRGLFHIYEAARREGARVVFASSNHTVGFYERSETITDQHLVRPDGYYGLSKAYGEMMGRLYWDKHAVESVFVRIGSATPEPVDARMLASWLSYGDLSRMMLACVNAPQITGGCAVIWGASKNSRMTWWGHDGRAIIGWEPSDSADGFAEKVGHVVTDNPVIERHMGGAYCAMGYTRKV